MNGYFSVSLIRSTNGLLVRKNEQNIKDINKNCT